MTSQHHTGTHPFLWQASITPVLIHFYDKPALCRYSSILHRYVYTHIYTYLCTYIYFPEGMFTYFLTSLQIELQFLDLVHSIHPHRISSNKVQLRCALHPLWIQHMIQLPATLCYLTDPQGVFPDQNSMLDVPIKATRCGQALFLPHTSVYTNPPRRAYAWIWDSERESCTSCRGLGLNHKPKPAPNDENSESGIHRMDWL